MTNPLIETAKALGERVAGLGLAVEQLDRRTNRSEKVTLAVVFGLLLDLVLSVAVGLVLVNLVSTNDRLQTAVDREAATRQQALCPMYQLFLGSYDANSPQARANRDAYDQAFVVLRKAYQSLDCKNAPVPGRADQPNATIPTPTPAPAS